MNDSSEVVPYLVCAIVINGVQTWLKQQPSYAKLVQEIPVADKWVHRAVAALGALVFALGIHVTYSGNYNSGWHALVEIPSLWALLHALADWSKVFVLQQGTYRWQSHPTVSVDSIIAALRAAGWVPPQPVEPAKKESHQ